MLSRRDFKIRCFTLITKSEVNVKLYRFANKITQITFVT